MYSYHALINALSAQYIHKTKKVQLQRHNPQTKDLVKDCHCESVPESKATLCSLLTRVSLKARPHFVVVVSPCGCCYKCCCCNLTCRFMIGVEYVSELITWPHATLLVQERDTDT